MMTTAMEVMLKKNWQLLLPPLLPLQRLQRRPHVVSRVLSSLGLG